MINGSHVQNCSAQAMYQKKPLPRYKILLIQDTTWLSRCTMDAVQCDACFRECSLTYYCYSGGFHLEVGCAIGTLPDQRFTCKGGASTFSARKHSFHLLLCENGKWHWVRWRRESNHGGGIWMLRVQMQYMQKKISTLSTAVMNATSTSTYLV